MAIGSGGKAIPNSFSPKSTGTPCEAEGEAERERDWEAGKDCAPVGG